MTKSELLAQADGLLRRVQSHGLDEGAPMSKFERAAGVLHTDIAKYLIDRAQAEKAADPQPVAWAKLRKVNMPYPGESGMRVIGFVVPDDGDPLGLIADKLIRLIGPDPRIAELEGLLREAVAWLHDDAGIKKRIRAALEKP